MGRSAKVHKRAVCSPVHLSLVQNPHSVTKLQKKASLSAQTKTTSSAPAVHVEKTAAVASSKKKAGLKEKAAAATGKRKPGTEGRVLGGADYVDVMMGGRRKAKSEVLRLPMDED